MLSEDKYEESTILSMLAQDSKYAFQVVFDRYRNTIYKVSMLYVKSPVIAEDIVQDVFFKLWFQRKNLPEIRSLESWLFILTKNLALNYLKKITHEWTARAKWVKENNFPQHPADQKTISAEYSQLLQQGIDQLSPQQQQVYKLAKEQGLSYEAIGKKLAISPLTVKTHMARALISIRLFLEKNGIVPFLAIVAGIAGQYFF